MLKIMQKLELEEFYKEIRRKNCTFNVSLGSSKDILVSFSDCLISVCGNTIEIYKDDTGTSMTIHLSVIDEIVKEDKSGMIRIRLKNGTSDVCITVAKINVFASEEDA